ncbi:LytTR family transcriptional regulator DNA-binding domain-containing protein [Gelatiniphilus marinus]|uniref:LytTR family transcriptional regulator DNA-binding domain-containing protein n=1 Tax=Gelatiniphilus marinus TaxID=1759464 RepID=A0ABW5JVR7_9FLAO
MRVQRGVIINKNYVNDIQKYFNSRYVITLNNKAQTSITNITKVISYNETIKGWINI